MLAACFESSATRCEQYSKNRVLMEERVEQLIRRNQCLIGFNLPTVEPQQIAENVPELLRLITQGKLKMFADSAFPLGAVKKAFEALSSRNTVGKVVLIP